MPVIKTKRNKVVADDPEPGDVVVQVSWPTPAGDGDNLKPFNMPWRPISEYAASLDWAVSMADKMANPIYVMPLNHREILNTSRFDPYRKLLANLSDQERGEVRQILVDACAGLMRDSEALAVRANAFDILKQLGVVTT